MTDLEKIYDKLLSRDCPPVEGNKKKSEGCYDAINDFGEMPDRLNCIQCWKDALHKAILEQPV